jgi:hypothetical protein
MYDRLQKIPAGQEVKRSRGRNRATSRAYRGRRGCELSGAKSCKDPLCNHNINKREMVYPLSGDEGEILYTMISF